MPEEGPFQREQAQAEDSGSDEQFVLVIEDNSEVADMLRWALELAGYRTIAHSGRGAFHTPLPFSYKPVLILLDLSMPLAEATVFLHTIRTQWKPEPPIIILTTSREIYNNLVGERVIRKPFRVSDLLTEVRKVLSP